MKARVTPTLEDGACRAVLTSPVRSGEIEGRSRD